MEEHAAPISLAGPHLGDTRDTPPGSAAEDAARLRRCLNDLVSIIALPALCTGGEPPRIIDTLFDALVGMLDAAFVFARLNDAEDGPPIEVGRVAKSWEGTLPTREIGKALDASLGDASRNWPPVTRVVIGGTHLSVASARVGLQGDIGAVIVGSERIDLTSTSTSRCAQGNSPQPTMN
jgi:hypothetical protein